MDLKQITHHGDALYDAMVARTTIAPLTTTAPDITVDDAYRISLRMLERRTSAGERVVGKKIGVTSKAVMTMLNVHQPDFGYLTDRMMYATGAEIPASTTLIAPRAEGEIDSAWLGEQIRVRAIPVRRGDHVVAVITRESISSSRRAPGALEQSYAFVFDRLAAHMPTREALQSQVDAARLKRLNQAATGRARQLEAALASLRRQDATLVDLQTGTASSIEAIRATVPADTTLLEYYVADGTLYAIVLSPQVLKVLRLGDMAAVERVLQLLRFQLAKFQLGPDYLRTFAPMLATASQRHLQELHALLIAPVQRFLDRPQLLIVPHGSLHYLPFQALFNGREYLVDRFALSYAPSATVFRLCQSTPISTRSRSLVLALADGYAPHIRREAEEVTGVLPEAELHLGDAATPERLKADGATARYVHVATHGFFRRDNPMLSAVRLSGGDLTLADLYALSLDADLVTLSGCGTGLSAVVGGDELVGLARGLLFAGARSVLLTMWQVDDYSTAEFMGRFYRRLMEGRSGAAAVADAMRAVRERFPHPYYWAPFVLIGKSSGPSIFPTPEVPKDSKGSAGGRLPLGVSQ